MNQFKVTGRVTESSGAPIGQAQVRLISDLATLGTVRGAVVSHHDTIAWNEVVTGFAGQRRTAYAKFVQPQVAGMSFADFRQAVVDENPALLASGYTFRPELQYRFPQNDPAQAEVRWERRLEGFSGNRWQCWQTYVAGKVLGMNWAAFKTAVVEQNPDLAQSDFRFEPDHTYRLPHNPQLAEYEAVTTTTSSGRYTVKGLPVGQYRVEVVVADAVRSTETVTLSTDLLHDIVIQTVHLPMVMAGEVMNFAHIQGGRFMINGEPFKRFIGLNIQGLVHYGRGDIGEMGHSRPEHQEVQLKAARNLGARVVRVFLAVKNRTAQEIGDRLEQLFEKARVHAPDLRFIPALTNFYHNFGQFVMGDEGFYQQVGQHSRLNTQFFVEGYKTNYLPYVAAIAERFANEPRIFAWEPGNELMCAANPAAFLDFMQDVSQTLKQKAPNHLVTTGMLSTRHSDLLIHPELRRALYQSPHIDFVTVHSYTMNADAADSPDDLIVFKDIELAQENNKPLVVEEAGIVRRTENDNDDRTPKLRKHLERWFSEGVTGGFMQWGFTADRSTGDGDKNSGLVNGEHQDFQQLVNAYHQRANELSA